VCSGAVASWANYTQNVDDILHYLAATVKLLGGGCYCWAEVEEFASSRPPGFATRRHPQKFWGL